MCKFLNIYGIDKEMSWASTTNPTFLQSIPHPLADRVKPWNSFKVKDVCYRVTGNLREELIHVIEGNVMFLRWGVALPVKQNKFLGFNIRQAEFYIA